MFVVVVVLFLLVAVVTIVVGGGLSLVVCCLWFVVYRLSFLVCCSCWLIGCLFLLILDFCRARSLHRAGFHMAVLCARLLNGHSLKRLMFRRLTMSEAWFQSQTRVIGLELCRINITDSPYNTKATRKSYPTLQKHIDICLSLGQTKTNKNF